MDVFRQRLEDEHDASVIITAPTVPYKGVRTLSNAMTCAYMSDSVLSRRDKPHR